MFKLFKKDAGIPIIKEIPAAAGTYKVGETLGLKIIYNILIKFSD